MLNKIHFANWLLIKVSILSFLIAMASNSSTAQQKLADTIPEGGNFEVMPDYPGGLKVFNNFIQQHLIYPEVAFLTGRKGKVVIEFIVEKDGSITNIRPISCVGAGCENEAERIIKSSRRWNPAIQNGRPVRAKFTIPILFNITVESTSIKQFKKSSYGFVFQKHGKEYLLDDVREIIGDKLLIASIENVIPYSTPSKYSMPDKKEIYLIVLKDE